jgi:hypothetical protein
MPQKQHYVPVFYLKRWAGRDDGRLCVYRRWQEHVESKRMHPDATGYAKDLYAIQGADAETENHLEGKFLSFSDDDAAQALGALETGATMLDGRLRSGWSRFIMTLIFRHPEAVSRLSASAAELAAKADRDFRENYANIRTVNDPETYEQYQREDQNYYRAKTAVTLLRGLMDNPRVGNQLNQMDWTVVRVENAPLLLTSDRPLMMPNGLVRSNSYLALPIGPTMLFVAANEKTTLQRVVEQDLETLVMRMNDCTTQQAQKYVWGFDDSYLEFVEQRLRPTNPQG